MLIGRPASSRATPSSPGSPVRERIIRRFFHLALSAVLVYYVLPEPILAVGGIPLPRAVGLVAFYMVAVSIEVARQARLVRLPSMRPYERSGVASYLWFATGATLLVLLVPATIAAPCIVACSVGDVVLGETRRWPRPVRIPMGIAACATPFLVFWQPWTVTGAVLWLLAILAGGIAVLAESLDIPLARTGSGRGAAPPSRLDDDLVMQIVPAAILWIGFAIAAAAGLAGILPAPFAPIPWFPTIRLG